MGLIVAAAVFAAVGGGLIRSQSEAVARAELDRQAEALAGIVSEQAERQLARGVEFTFIRPSNLQALVGPNTQLYYSGLQLTPGGEHPTGEIPSVAAREIDFGVLERDEVQRVELHAAGASRGPPRPRRRRSTWETRRSAPSC